MKMTHVLTGGACLALMTVKGVAHPGHDASAGFDLASAAGFTGATPSETNRVSITVEGDYRVIRANGLPDHVAGQFPNRNNPNRISAQNYNFRVPLHPQAAATTSSFALGLFGIAVNGVVFDPGAAEWWNGDREWQYEPLAGAINLGVDASNAHVQPTGAYHYHAIPTGLLSRLTGGKPKVALVGWAADGFPIYGPWGFADATRTNSALKKLSSSYRVKQGVRPSGPGGNYDGTFVADYEFVKGAGDLDECNGRFGPTPEFPGGTYYYVLTEDWPFIPRQFHGTPDASFLRRGPGGMRPGFPGGPQRRPGPPPFGPRPPMQGSFNSLKDFSVFTLA
ncbi:MAG: YHYH protein [Verrucomicrobiota bacterium]